MSFDIKNIGKFIEMKSVRYSTFPFQLVMGYDFIRNNYIVGEIDFIPSLYSAASSILSKEKIVFYSLEEVLKLIDDRIEIENKKLSKHARHRPPRYLFPFAQKPRGNRCRGRSGRREKKGQKAE